MHGDCMVVLWKQMYVTSGLKKGEHGSRSARWPFKINSVFTPG